ncbi:hypothetical protein [Vibrio palustris]|uniref:Uncharacterized protein n=1 Tax=Vibrio palustris TaxID=1918946 RepID=A0A1R4B517_9VIBR|nr:hypothetical protein [Vibrio palustris]SJL84014.1 hypothetical protein VPAL9027_01994 [Vibrio palustris]
MEPFKISNELRDVVSPYPEAKLILDAAKRGGELAKHAIARQWLSEGIPYAFRYCPGIYEALRLWIGTRLSVEPKEINLTGSARLGQSLSPKKMGNPFNEGSDLDIFIVSSGLFERITSEFNEWSFEYESELIQASNDRENTFWRNNLQRCPKNINRGFIDCNVIPNREKYTLTRNISQTMYLLKQKLDITDNAPKISHASIRCYKSWDSYVRQVSLGFE